ncbi:MAG: DUF424 family protein [Thermoplasmata archaeon]|jgi:hypothetical protein|nr:DUF424 family protein [Thermoplasmata archaeon]
MFVKIHRNEREVILAACDEDLIGRTFREEGKRLDVNELFYKGEAIGRDGLVERMKSVTIMNLVGEETVAIAIEEGFASEDSVIEIDGIKHVQVVLL